MTRFLPLLVLLCLLGCSRPTRRTAPDFETSCVPMGNGCNLMIRGAAVWTNCPPVAPEPKARETTALPSRQWISQTCYRYVEAGAVGTNCACQYRQFIFDIRNPFTSNGVATRHPSIESSPDLNRWRPATNTRFDDPRATNTPRFSFIATNDFATNFYRIAFK